MCRSYSLTQATGAFQIYLLLRDLIELFDSLHTLPTAGGSIFQQICTIAKSNDPTIAINVPLQTGDCDCGLYAIAMACDLCSGTDPFGVKYCQGKMRSHLKSCFENEAIESFPSTPNSTNSRILKSVIVPLHCICRMPGMMPMACCDQCNVWYHKGCVSIPQ